MDGLNAGSTLQPYWKKTLCLLDDLLSLHLTSNVLEKDSRYHGLLVRKEYLGQWICFFFIENEEVG